VLFNKNVNTIQRPFGPIRIPHTPSDTRPSEVDYEVELAVVIGKPALNVPVEKALDYVLGYAWVVWAQPAHRFYLSRFLFCCA
jgi:2-keto-4-pentenoate hydratase/2-oxohepta-3-ene-1,7-dioic acid hydratase in catechol pathway